MATLYSNGYYQITDSLEDIVKIYDRAGQLVLTGLAYSARYGVVANNAGAEIGSGVSEITVNADEIVNFSVGDPIEIHSGAINNSLMAKAVITNITGNRISFTPALATPGEEAYTHSRRVLKTTLDIDALDIISYESDAISGGTLITVNCTSAVAAVTIEITCLDASPSISISVQTTYTSDNLNVFYERLILAAYSAPTEIYTKNRKAIRSGLTADYWLDKQGVKFGTGVSSMIIYHTPAVSSLELNGQNNILIVNLDHMDDHHYRWLKETTGGMANRRFRDKHCSVYSSDDSRTNSFSILVGVDVSMPRLMLNPSGFLATYIFTEHADYGQLATHRATVFGHQDITASADATAGFAFNNIPMTKSVFYSGTGSTGIGINDVPAFDDFCTDLLTNKGFEIVPHSPGYTEDTPAAVESMLAGMADPYAPKSWIDHSADFNREDISADGLTAGTSYCKEIWESYGIKYFWQYSSEDNWASAGCGNMHRPGEGTNLRTPLWWRHPTIMADFITWATDMYLSSTTTANAWDERLSAVNLDALIDDWGVVINHGYYCYQSQNNGILEYSGEKWQLRAAFNTALSRLAARNTDINITTVKKALDYWLALENVEIAVTGAHTFTVTNNGASAITGLALAMRDASNVLVDNAAADYRKVGDDTIIWFDLAANTTVTITHSIRNIFPPINRFNLLNNNLSNLIKGGHHAGS